MKKKMLLRGVLGIPLGISISYVISIITSFIYGNGKFFVCSPLLIEYAGYEINAVVLQTVLSALLGMIFAGGSVVWDMEQWSIAKQTGIYFTRLCDLFWNICCYLCCYVAYSIFYLETKN